VSALLVRMNGGTKSGWGADSTRGESVDTRPFDATAVWLILPTWRGNILLPLPLLCLSLSLSLSICLSIYLCIYLSMFVYLLSTYVMFRFLFRSLFITRWDYPSSCLHQLRCLCDVCDTVGILVNVDSMRLIGPLQTLSKMHARLTVPRVC